MWGYETVAKYIRLTITNVGWLELPSVEVLIVSVRDGDAAKMSRVRRNAWRKCHMSVRSKMLCLTLPHQITTPQIVKVKFLRQILSPKQKCKENKQEIKKIYKINFLHIGTKHFL
jgi:hypothetical protein